MAPVLPAERPEEEPLPEDTVDELEVVVGELVVLVKEVVDYHLAKLQKI